MWQGEGSVCEFQVVGGVQYLNGVNGNKTLVSGG